MGDDTDRAPPPAPDGPPHQPPPYGSAAPADEAPARPAVNDPTGCGPDASRPYATDQGMPPPSATYGTIGDRGGQPPVLAPPPGVPPPPGWAPPDPRAGHPRPDGSPGVGPPGPEPTTAQRLRARRLGQLALVNAALAFLVTVLVFPLGAIAGAAFAISAVLVGIRARRAAVSARSSEAAGVVGVVLGSVGIAMTVVIGAFWLVLWGELTSYQDCTQGANTLAAEQVCRERLEVDVRDRFGFSTVR